MPDFINYLISGVEIHIIADAENWSINQLIISNTEKSGL